MSDSNPSAQSAHTNGQVTPAIDTGDPRRRRPAPAPAAVKPEVVVSETVVEEVIAEEEIVVEEAAVIETPVNEPVAVEADEPVEIAAYDPKPVQHDQHDVVSVAMDTPVDDSADEVVVHNSDDDVSDSPTDEVEHVEAADAAEVVEELDDEEEAEEEADEEVADEDTDDDCQLTLYAASDDAESDAVDSQPETAEVRQAEQLDTTPETPEPVIAEQPTAVDDESDDAEVTAEQPAEVVVAEDDSQSAAEVQTQSQSQSVEQPVAAESADVEPISAQAVVAAAAVASSAAAATKNRYEANAKDNHASKAEAKFNTKPDTEPTKPKAAKVEADGPLFRNLDLREEVQEAIESSGYTVPTPIQAEIIPYMLDGRDVLAQSQTGTGKTAAFALPILSRLDYSKRTPQVLVLAPTRELAMQVAASFSTYARHLPQTKVAAIYGGADYAAQFRQLKNGAQVVVGTPGRVIDHIKRGSLQLAELDCLVLDEADEMLNMGFLDDVKFVLEQTNDERQIALFSATLPAPIRSIAQQYLTNPARITIKTKTMTAESIRQRAVFVSPREKVDVLRRMIEVEDADGVIVFTKTRESTITVAEKLSREGLSAVALNGDMPQRQRERTIQQLKAGQLDILVATDVAARGLDVTRISHVFNYDLPHGTESYIHRIGRTGRAGRDGEAIIFLTHRERYRLKNIERVTKQQIQIVDPPGAKEVNEMRVKRFKKQITEAVAAPDIRFFQQMVSEVAEESSLPLEQVAAALAHMTQQGRSFFMKEGRKRDEAPADRSNERGGGKYDRKPYNKNGAGGPGGGADRKRKQSGPPEEGKTRYRIEIGWRDGVKPGNIVGAIANEAGIAGSNIGHIAIHDAYSTIDLPDNLTNDVYQSLKETRVVGKHLRLKLAGKESAPTTPGSGSAGGSGGYKKKPGKGYPGNGKAYGKKKFGKKNKYGAKRPAK